MNEMLQIESLSHKHRHRFFVLLVVIFVLSLPALIFYTKGYRLDFSNEENAIITTGGVYVTTNNLDVEVYLDEEKVRQPRLFRSAYYIQDISAGLHRIVVQRPDLNTWVKVLPIEAHIVVETSAFNMPLVPHLRPITKYVTATGTPIYFTATEDVKWLDLATSTEPIYFSEQKSLLDSEFNEEYIFVESLFATTTDKERQSVFEKIFSQSGVFNFSTTSKMENEATTTKEMISRGGIDLVEREAELYAVWTGYDNSIPYYYCIASTTASTTALWYGEHVAEQMTRLSQSTTTPIVKVGIRVCRTEIKIDIQRQDVYFYDFYPNSSDLILLQLEDGLYVTEIDDRAWQNSQLIYPGDDFSVVVENDVIYIKDGDYYFELITEIEPV